MLSSILEEMPPGFINQSIQLLQKLPEPHVFLLQLGQEDLQLTSCVGSIQP